MIDLSSLDNYMIDVDNDMTTFIAHEIAQIGVDAFIEYNYKNLDCTRVWNNGMRPMQTINYPYKYFLTEFIYIIQTYIPEELQNEWYNKLLIRHNANLEYEQLNPPIIYKDKRIKTKNKDKLEKQQVKTKSTYKISNAEKKLATKVAKLNMLSIKIKPIN